jgi:nucleoside permease NupC
MLFLKNIVSISIIVLLCLLIFPDRAYAYVDPGTGSIIIQFLLGFIVVGAVLLKVFWNRVLNFVKRLFKRNSKNE